MLSIKQNFKLFLIFSKIGAFTIGGGYAMLPLIEHELVEKEKLLTEDTFHNGLALSQSSPGPIAVNIAIFLGYRIGGVFTSLLVALAVILPAFITISLLTGVLIKFNDSPYLIKFFKGVRPAVAGMIAFSLINLIKKTKLNILNISLLLTSCTLLILGITSPIIIILLLIITGIIWEGSSK